VHAQLGVGLFNRIVIGLLLSPACPCVLLDLLVRESDAVLGGSLEVVS
jgi:hypothetical protein